MARNESQQELYEAELARLTASKSELVIAAIAADSVLNTANMIEHLEPYLGSDKELAELVQRTARGENALLKLVNKLAVEIGERQAEYEIQAAAAHNREVSIADRIHRYLDSRVPVM